MSIDLQHRQLIEQFYAAFQQLDASQMASCYADEIVFQDPAFGELQGAEVKKMWAMLIARGADSLKIDYYDTLGTPAGGSATWEARYLFGKNRRPVHNTVRAHFVIDQNKIVQHTDWFSFWIWSSMALGLPGHLLGFTGYLQRKVQRRSQAVLKKYMENHPS